MSAEPLASLDRSTLRERALDALRDLPHVASVALSDGPGTRPL
jgi:hypothetical protein